MKKVILCTVTSLVLLMGQGAAMAACDPSQRSMQLQKAIMEAAQKDPSKVAAVQADMQALAQETAKLVSEGKLEDICKRYDAMEAKLK